MEMVSLEERITLRGLMASDLDYFYSWASDPLVAQNMTWEAYTSRCEAEKFLKDVVEKHPWFKAICVDGVPVGSITLNQGKDASSCRAELGYVLAKAFWGKNIATIAVIKAIKLGFSELKIQRIDAFVDPENIPSQKVLLKAGLSCEGLLRNYIIFKGQIRDRYIYSITI